MMKANIRDSFRHVVLRGAKQQLNKSKDMKHKIEHIEDPDYITLRTNYKESNPASYFKVMEGKKRFE